jgi:hypothetical protein
VASSPVLSPAVVAPSDPWAPFFWRSAAIMAPALLPNCEIRSSCATTPPRVSATARLRTYTGCGALIENPLTLLQGSEEAVVWSWRRRTFHLGRKRRSTSTHHCHPLPSEHLPREGAVERAVSLSPWRSAAPPT